MGKAPKGRRLMDYNALIADYVSTHRETLEKRAKELRERNKASKKQEPEKKDA